MFRGFLGEVVIGNQYGSSIGLSRIPVQRGCITASWPALDTDQAPNEGLLGTQMPRHSLLFSIEQQYGIPLRKVRSSQPISFRSIHNTYSLANNFYRRRNISLPILALPSPSMLLLLHAQELSLEQHPACNNEDRHRANNRYHAA